MKRFPKYMRSRRGVCIFDHVTKSLIMLLIWILRVLATLYVASASPFIGTGNQDSRITLPSNVSHLTLLSNVSTTASNVSTKNALNIACDAAQYGDNLNITDCKDAKLYISSGSEQFPWVDRRTFYPKAHFALPYRYLGGKYRLLFIARRVVY